MYHDLFPDTDYYDQYINYVKSVVSRYPQITHWEVGNEPFNTIHLSKRTGNLFDEYLREDSVIPQCPYGMEISEKYCEILQLSYKAIKEVNPNITVLLGGLGVHRMEYYANRIYNNGGKPYFDIMNIHPYDDEIYLSVDKIKKIKEIMDANDDGDKEIWLTEFGYTLDFDSDTLAEDEYNRKTKLSNFLSTVIENIPFVTGLFWYSLDGTQYSLLDKNGNWLESAYVLKSFIDKTKSIPRLPYIQFVSMMDSQNNVGFVQNSSASPKKEWIVIKDIYTGDTKFIEINLESTNRSIYIDHSGAYHLWLMGQYICGGSEYYVTRDPGLTIHYLYNTPHNPKIKEVEINGSEVVFSWEPDQFGTFYYAMMAYRKTEDGWEPVKNVIWGDNSKGSKWNLSYYGSLGFKHSTMMCRDLEPGTYAFYLFAFGWKKRYFVDTYLKSEPSIYTITIGKE
jgi:hypothetical protein